MQISSGGIELEVTIDGSDSPQLQASGATVEQVTQLLAASPTASGGTMGESLHADGIETMAIGLLGVDASVLDRVLDGTIAPEFDPSRPIDAPVTAVADPAIPDAITQPADLEELAATSPDVTTATIPDTGHLIHDAKSGREAVWTLIDEFLHCDRRRR